MNDRARQSAGTRPRAGLLLQVLLLLLLLAGVLFWSFLLPRAENSVFGRVPILDEIYYLDRAAELSPGALCPPEPCFMSPLYPQLIRLAGSAAPVPEDRVVEPGRLRGLRMLQTAFWLGTVLLLAWIGWRDLTTPTAGRRRRLAAAALPAILFFLYRPAAAYAIAILVEMPLAFLVTAAVALLPGRWETDRVRLWRWAALGLVLGLAGLLRGTVLAFLPAVAWLVVRHTVKTGGRAITAVLVLAGAVLLVMLVPVLHNSRQAGRLSPPTLNGGVNLYIGNGPQANGFYVAAVPGQWRTDPAGRRYLAEQLDRPELSLAQADSVWSSRAWHSIDSHRGRAAGLWARKFLLHLQGWEIDQLLPLGAWTRQVPPARLLIVPYGLLVALGLGYGLWVLVRRPGHPAAVWMLGLLLIIALQSVFFVVSRYRLVLVPLWVLLAGSFLVEQELRWRVRGLLVLAGLLVAVPWGLGGVRKTWAAMAQANEARRWAQVGLVEESPRDLRHARDLYRHALDAGARGAVAWRGLIAVDHALRDETALAEDLTQALVVFPADRELLKQRISGLLALHREDQALPLLRGILEDHPRDADSLHNLAVLLAGRGESVEAERLADDLVKYHPDDPRGFIDLGVILIREGHKERARAVFERGLVLHPDDPALQRNLRVLDSSSPD